MKRRKLERYLTAAGCRLDREGAEHSMWINPRTGRKQATPRHIEIKTPLVRKICRLLSVEPPQER